MAGWAPAPHHAWGTSSGNRWLAGAGKEEREVSSYHHILRWCWKTTLRHWAPCIASKLLPVFYVNKACLCDRCVIHTVAVFGRTWGIWQSEQKVKPDTPLEFIQLFPSAVTSSTDTSDPAPLVATQYMPIHNTAQARRYASELHELFFPFILYD